MTSYQQIEVSPFRYRLIERYAAYLYNQNKQKSGNKVSVVVSISVLQNFFLF